MEAALRRGERVFLCLVAEATKGSPGTPGAALVLAETGDPVGTIGGGGMEQRLLAEARAALAAPAAPAEARCETLYHRRGALGRESGLICGGSQTHLSLVLEPSRDLATVQSLRAALDREADAGLEITPAGWRGVSSVAADAPERRLERAGGSWSYRERLLNPRRIAILGGGHCGVALAELMRGLGYAVRVFETRADLYTLKRLPPSEVGIVPDFAAAGGAVRWPERTLAVVMTAAFPTDVEALAGLFPHPFPWIGLMGARAKLARIREALTARGVAADHWTRVTAPVGLPLASDTPEEIAVSIAAQILLNR